MSAALTWPATFVAGKFSLRLKPNNRRFQSPYNNSVQVLDLIGERWMASLEMPVNSYALAQALEAFFAQLRGMDGTVQLWHLARPIPSGTMRGSPTLSATAVQGAQSIAVTTTAGATVRAGDMLGVGTHLLMAAADATANGSRAITITLANRLRTSLSSGAAVVWNQPKATFRLMSDDSAGAIEFGKAIAAPFAVEFLETF